ncbi:nucleotidyltransferase [Oceanobacillus sp. FSL K6-3682]|uniref:nucleotidyltransferase domain-containing protein n=1 Tax=Oceanobacillus sp. FSL K6-3682 TaxID=2921503 RepID=UPI0030D96BB9
MVLCIKQFNKFHDNIRLLEENEVLKEKRDIIINTIKNNLPKETSKSFTIFTQGSYAMHTGIKPLDNDYDIDVGLYFDISKEDIKPVQAKQWILNAVEGHTKDVKMKNPCITVAYAAGYHVDITVYAAENADGKVYLAKGKPTSNGEDKCWEESNPKDLIKEIRDHLSDSEDRKQFRRIIRYLKRWKDEKLIKGNGRPTGIALTSCAYNWFAVEKDVDPFSGDRTYKDLDALIALIRQMINGFSSEVERDENGELNTFYRLKVELPVEPYSDLFEKMSNKQMNTFKQKLERLLESLEEARSKEDPTDAAEILQKQFGKDFPVSPRPTTGKRATQKAVIPSSESAKK